jgi:hypothetical protein
MDVIWDTTVMVIPELKLVILALKSLQAVFIKLITISVNGFFRF